MSAENNENKNSASRMHLATDFSRKLLSGLVAGIVSRTAIAPIERVIIISQTKKGVYTETTTSSILRAIYINEGFRGLFRGNAANLSRAAPSTAIELSSFNLYKKLLPQEKLGSTGTFLLSGAMAGWTAYSIMYPLDVVRTFHSLGLYRDSGVLPTLGKIIKEHGLRRCYRGLLATCCGITPYAGIKLATFEKLKAHFGSLSTLQSLAFGAFSGAFAVTISYPTDVIRRNYQYTIIEEGKATYRDTFRLLYSRGLAKGFYSGLLPTYYKIIPSVALTFGVNEFIISTYHTPN